MSENPSPAPDDDRPRKFRITRKRLGIIRFVDPNGEYGFIDAEDFREDVFFHHSVWEAAGGPLAPAKIGDGSHRRSRNPRASGPRDSRNEKLDPETLVRQHVEFEIDDEMFESEQKLRATTVKPTRRPMGRKLSGRDATFNIVTHHPRARRKRPDWRK